MEYFATLHHDINITWYIPGAENPAADALTGFPDFSWGHCQVFQYCHLQCVIQNWTEWLPEVPDEMKDDSWSQDIVKYHYPKNTH